MSNATQTRKPTRSMTYEEWEAALDRIVERNLEISLYDLEDYATYDAWADGVSPSAFYRETIAPNCTP